MSLILKAAKGRFVKYEHITLLQKLFQSLKERLKIADSRTRSKYRCRSSDPRFVRTTSAHVYSAGKQVFPWRM